MTAVAAAPRPGLLPRWLLPVAVGLLALLVAGVAALRAAGWQPAVPPGALLSERLLRFSDGAGGTVEVVDAGTGQPVATLRGEHGFLRGVLRGVARERRQRGLAAAPALRLALHDDGRLLLVDPDTRQQIDLASFGPDNAAVFLAWLPPHPFTDRGRP